jgi:predicted nuclease of predicted toxin-antitoxin system
VKVLADENVDFPIIKELRNKGIDVDSISEKNGGIADEEVLEIANKSGRILITADKDYGELVYRLK